LSQSVTVHYKEALPPESSSANRSVFFMNGARFSLKTLQLVAAIGYRAVTVDIPGTSSSYFLVRS